MSTASGSSESEVTEARYRAALKRRRTFLIGAVSLALVGIVSLICGIMYDDGTRIAYLMNTRGMSKKAAMDHVDSISGSLCGIGALLLLVTFPYLVIRFRRWASTVVIFGSGPN
jgi:hypothetical protein